MHNFTLLENIALALGAAFVGGLIFQRIGLPTIVGYLLAGVAIGPFTPGYTGDTQMISELAELGIIFLMFGVGLRTLCVGGGVRLRWRSPLLAYNYCCIPGPWCPFPLSGC